MRHGQAQREVPRDGQNVLRHQDLELELLDELKVSGWFMLEGRHGVRERGTWFIAAGMVPANAAILIFEWMQK